MAGRTVAVIGQGRRKDSQGEESEDSGAPITQTMSKGANPRKHPGKNPDNNRWQTGESCNSGEQSHHVQLVGGSFGDMHEQRIESRENVGLGATQRTSGSLSPQEAPGELLSAPDLDMPIQRADSMEDGGAFPVLIQWPEDLSEGPNHMLKLVEKQVNRLALSRRLHAVFDAEGAVEELFADRHLLLTRTLFFTSFSMILISVAVMSIESLPEYFDRGLPTFFWIETVCIAWFTVELLIRFCTCQDRGEFCKEPLNIVDFAAIFPYYLENFILKYAYGGSGGTDGLLILRVVRLTRVFRVFKLSKYDEGVQVVFASLKKSTDALSLLIFLTALAMVLFGALIFVAEQAAADFNETTRTWVRKEEYGGASEKHKINSIPIGFWWCLVTLTTVGYGDMYPVTIYGYIVGAIAMMAGLLIVAFPIIIIGANFTEVREEWRANQAEKKKNAPRRKRKKEIEVETGPVLGGAAANAVGPALSTHLTELAAKPRTYDRTIGRVVEGEDDVQSQPGSLYGGQSLKEARKQHTTAGRFSFGPRMWRRSADRGNEAGQAAARGEGGRTTPRGAGTTPNAASQGRTRSGSTSSRLHASTNVPVLPTLPLNQDLLARPSSSRQHLTIPAYPPPDPPDPGAQDAGLLAQKLLQRLSKLEETISQVVADTVQEELRRERRRSENCSQL